MKEKIKEFFVYTVWQNIINLKDYIRRDIPYGTKNLIRFFKLVWVHRDWDYDYILTMQKFQLELLLKGIKKYANEVDETRIPKEKDMERCIEILNNLIDDNYAKRCGYKYTGKVVFIPIKGTELSEYSLFGGQSQEELHDIFQKSYKLQEEETEELYNLLKKSQSWWD